MDDNPVFNIRQLLQSTDGDQELAGQITGMFLGDTPAQISALNAALDAGDAKTAERVAHSIKGAAATVGGDRLRHTAFACECLARDGKLDDCKNRMAEVASEFAALGQEMATHGFTA